MSEFPLILMLRKENKQNSDMTWQRYKLNLRNSLLLGGKFSGYGAISFVLELVKSPKQRIVLIDNSVPRLYHQQYKSR